MSAQSLMIQTCDIATRLTSLSSSGAAGVPSVTATASGVPCNIQQLSATDALRHGAELGTQVFRCFLPSVFEGSALVVGHGDLVTSGSVAYRVVGPAAKPVPQAQHLELTLELDAP